MRTLKRGILWFVRLLPIAIIFVGVGWLWTHQGDAITLPQDEMHEKATVSADATMCNCPREHKVIVKPVGKAWVGVLANYLPPPVGSGGRTELQGLYDPNDGHIEITGGLARLSAAMPNDALRSFFYRALRHEYGHAFLDDWLRTAGGGNREWEATLQDAQHVDAAALPRQLRDCVAEYRTEKATAYGQSYFMGSFNEYMAESYARLLSGQDVPPKTGKFLRTVGSQ